MRPLILVGLNEIDFGLVRRYLDTLALPNFRRLLDGPQITTTSESRYEQLEPWIQWVSIHSGLRADEHGITRLGDIIGSDVPQIFEQLEAHGFPVGCVCAMNAENRLRDPAYFVPDPWTQTPSDGSWWSRALGEAIRQAVNDNANGRLTAKSALQLVLGLLRFAAPRHYPTYLRLAATSRRAPWRKALFLDLFLHDWHRALHRRTSPAFSTVFLNAGAHIQHHYLFNAERAERGTLRNPESYVEARHDPVAEMLQVYDTMLGDYLDRTDVDLLVATGLSQRPYDRIKFYHRLRDHAQFLRALHVPFRTVVPRMTRDFLLECDSDAQAREAQAALSAVTAGTEHKRLFAEIDNRGRSLFVTLSYPDAIGPDTQLHAGALTLPLQPHVAFVAIKNGMHDPQGHAFFRGGVAQHAPADGSHVSRLHHVIRGHFGLDALRAGAHHPHDAAKTR